MRIETVLIVYQHTRILLALKKKKFGIGKYNGFGGEVEKGETLEQAASREAFEEGNIHVINPERMGEILFQFEDGEQDHHVHFFRANEYRGEPTEQDEMKQEWFDVAQIPYDRMWSDDRYWLPLLLEGKKFRGHFVFNKQREISRCKLEEVEEL